MNENQQAVIDYYNAGESKKGYNLLLHGTKHFGYYKKGDSKWQFNKAMRQMEAKLATTLALPSGSKVLDAGCGVGDVASYLAKHKGYQIEGIDILDFNIEEAERRIKANGLQSLVHVQLMSYEELSFPPDSFDAVYTMETFVHSSNPEKALKGFYKALKPSGKLVMFEYSRDNDNQMSPRAQKVFAYINKYAAMPAFQRFTHGTQERLMKEAGFNNVRVTNISKHMANMMKAFSLMAFIPYQVIRVFGKQSRYINAMSAVEFHRYGKHIRYNIYTATKPTTKK
jgi:sterol 24-C-methyltransferase